MNLVLTDEEHKTSHSLEEHDVVGVGDVGGEDGGDDGSDLNTSGVVEAVVEILGDLGHEVAEVEVLDAARHGVHEVSDTTAGVVSDLVRDGSPVRDDRVETAELHGISDRSQTQTID